jgi:hypothetical protein
MTMPGFPCQSLCTATATLHVSPVQVTGVCDFPISGFIISDVVVTGCVVTSVLSLVVRPQTVLITLEAVVTFDYTATFPDGSSEGLSNECLSTIEFLLTPVTPPEHLVEELPCTGNLSCTAIDAGFDPVLSAQEFVVTVTGSISCYGCQRAVVNVSLCPSDLVTR